MLLEVDVDIESGIPDANYVAPGAEMSHSRSGLYAAADLVLRSRNHYQRHLPLYVKDRLFLRTSTLLRTRVRPAQKSHASLSTLLMIRFRPQKEKYP